MDNLITSLQSDLMTILENGGAIVLAALIIGQVLKLWLDEDGRKKLIPTINACIGAVLGIAIPHIFPDHSIIVCAIYGAACGIFSSVIYDKVFDKE